MATTNVKHVTTTVNGIPHTTTVKVGSSGSSGASSSAPTTPTPSSFVNGVDTIRAPGDKHGQNKAAGIFPSDEEIPTGIEQTSQAGQPEQPVNPEQTGQLSYQDALKNLNSGGLTGTALTNAQNTLAAKYNQPPQTPFTQAHQQLQQTGAAPSDGGAAMAAVQAAKPYTPDQTAVDQVFSSDPVINNLMSSAWDLLSPENTKTSLMDDYKKLYKQSGLEDINQEMIDAETVINGTEDDIRNEIQTAGGFGTDSQIQAMSLARNKNLLKRYNALAEMQTNAQNQLNTMLNLDSQDRQMAQQRVSAQVSALFNFANMRQSMTNAVREQAQWQYTNMGADGLYAAYKDNPTALSGLEQNLGIAPGGLAPLAAQAKVKRDAETALLQAQLDNARAPKIETINGQSAQYNPKTGQWEAVNLDGSVNQEAASMAQDKVNSINSILTNTNGLKQVARPGIVLGRGAFDFTGSQAAIIGDIQQITSGLTLDALEKAKQNGATFGALSDGERAVLASSATKIGSWEVHQDGDPNKPVVGYKVDPATMQKELDRINNYAKLDALNKGIDPTAVGVQLMPDKHYYTQNSDGSYTLIK